MDFFFHSSGEHRQGVSGTSKNTWPSVRQSLLSLPTLCCRATHGLGRTVCVQEEACFMYGKVQVDEEDTIQEVISCWLRKQNFSTWGWKPGIFQTEDATEVQCILSFELFIVDQVFMLNLVFIRGERKVWECVLCVTPLPSRGVGEISALVSVWVWPHTWKHSGVHANKASSTDSAWLAHHL